MPRTSTRIAKSLLPLIFQGGLSPKEGHLDINTGDMVVDGEHYPNQAAPRPGGSLYPKPPTSLSANMLAPQDEPLTTPASSAITVTKGGNPSIEMRPIPEGQQRVGEPADQTLRRINLKNDIMGNTGADQQYRDDLSSPPLRPEMPANMLAPQDPAVYGQPSPSGQIMDENAIRERRVETNKQGRPTPNITMQGDQQTLDYQNRLATMQPDKEGGGWWPAIRAAIGGLAAGGPVGAAAAFGTRKLREHFDPELGSREYKAQEMSRLAPAVETIRQNRKDARTEEATQAATGLAKARTKALTDPKSSTKWIIKQDENGVYRPVNQATGMDPDGKPVKGKTVSGNDWEIKVDRNDRYVPVNKRTGLDQNGKPVIARSPAAKDVEDVTFTNQNIQQGIREAQASMDKIDAGLVGVPRTIEGTDPLTGVKKMVSNPDYTFNMSERRRLEHEIRNLRIKLKSAKKPTATQDDDPDPLGIMNDDE